MKKLLTLIVSLLPISTFALGLINDFEWLEPNNSVVVVVGEEYQLKFNCSDNSLPFTSDYADSWNHYDFEGGQHMVSTPTGYSIDDMGVIKGLNPGSYAIKFTGFILAKSGAEKMLMISVASERSETEPNNSFDTANDIYGKIRFGLYNTSDIDFFRFTHSSLKPGDNVTFKIHYYGSREEPFGYKWSTFCGTDMIGGGSLISQDQECKALVTLGNTVFLEAYFDQSRSQYFNYGEEFVAEVYINGVPASEYENDEPYDQQDMINGHEYVDLGLPSGKLWAKTNYGAATEGDYGAYVDWPSRNIVQSVWGEEWSTPSQNDIEELFSYCSFSWEYNSNSVFGCSVTGANGKSIFLPAAGFRIMGNPQVEGQSIYYWSDNEYESGFAGSLSGSQDSGISTHSTYNYSYVTMPIRPVAVKKQSGQEDDPNKTEYVDLALPSGNLWAKTNIGANSEYEYGDKYAFGETSTKNQYMEDSYIWLDQSTNTYTKYTTDGVNADYKTVLDPEDDAAAKVCGSMWKTPSRTDFIELLNYCSSSWENLNGVSGRRFTGANGNSIFLPAAGFVYWYNQYKDELGYYMTSDIVSNERLWLFYFSSSEMSTGWMNVKYQGYSVRPITNEEYTGVEPISGTTDSVESFYDINGTKKVNLSKGLNIVRMKDGRTKKVVVK